jgi:hypothetical protein
LVIGGAMALMLNNRLHRRTEHIDVADEIPAAVRNETNMNSSTI